MRMKSVKLVIVMLLMSGVFAQAAVNLKPASTKEGYLARLLLNEVPFPGEPGWVSEQDSKDAMLSILWVLHSRIKYVPPGYRQTEVAAVKTRDIIDVITVGGVHGQCEGFYRDASGKPVMSARIPKRIDHLMTIAGRGKPGRFARLINYAQSLADDYFAGGLKRKDLFAGLKTVNGVPVTGRAYSWMTDRAYYHPGGDFVKIPNQDHGSLGGNRFSTLKQREKQ